jgi:hypothetical protein
MKRRVFVGPIAPPATVEAVKFTADALLSDSPAVAPSQTSEQRQEFRKQRRALFLELDKKFDPREGLRMTPDQMSGWLEVRLRYARRLIA